MIHVNGRMAFVTQKVPLRFSRSGPQIALYGNQALERATSDLRRLKGNSHQDRTSQNSN